MGKDVKDIISACFCVYYNLFEDFWQRKKVIKKSKQA